MVILARRSIKKGESGFTLLELLLTVALLLGLMAALVFNFAPLQRGANLEEGGRQFEALVRFAAAQAANTGRAIQFQFDEISTNDFTSTNRQIRVVREVDPYEQPGLFEDVPEAEQFLAELLERVRIVEVKGGRPPVNLSTNEVRAVEGFLNLPQPITFFADGSSDTADISLASRDAEDTRRFTVHLAGVTGSIRTELISAEEWTNPALPVTSDENAPAQTSEDTAETMMLPRETTPTNGFSNADRP